MHVCNGSRPSTWGEHQGITPTCGDTGAQKRGLAAARAADHAEPSVRSQLLDRLRDRLIATEEPIAVIRAVGAQPLIGAFSRRRRLEVVRGDRVNLFTRCKTSDRVR